MGKDSRRSAIQRFAARLKYPQIFMLVLAIFLLDLVVPDFIPFADEIMLGLLTVLLGTWRERGRPAYEQEEPREKNITPPRR
jgi:hypothetical protein